METIKVTNTTHRTSLGAIKFVIGGVPVLPGQSATVKASDIDEKLEKAFTGGLLARGEVTEVRACHKVNTYPPCGAAAKSRITDLSLSELKKMCKAVGISQKGAAGELRAKLEDFYGKD